MLKNVLVDPAILYLQPGLRRVVQVGEVVVPVLTAEDVIDLAERVAAIRASSVLIGMRLKPCAGRRDGLRCHCPAMLSGDRGYALPRPWAAAVAAVHPGVTQYQLLHPTQMQCSADLAPVMCWHT